jgi:hypothetical protein
MLRDKIDKDLASSRYKRGWNADELLEHVLLDTELFRLGISLDHLTPHVMSQLELGAADSKHNRQVEALTEDGISAPGHGNRVPCRRSR